MVGNSTHIPRTYKYSLPGRSGLIVNMNLQLWHLIFTAECIFICVSSESLPLKRWCVFIVTPNRNNNTARYSAVGNVSGSVQVCEKTQCCVGYYLVRDGELKVDVLACSIVEKSCPNVTCQGQTSNSGKLIACVCNADFCNNNITWSPESEQPPFIYSYSAGEIMKAAVGIVIGTLLMLCFVIVAAKLRILYKKQNENLQPCRHAPPLCSCQTANTCEINIDDIELQQIVDHGNFATVWQGEYQGSMVAVKVFPADWKTKFTAEKEIYELPLMKHAGIVHFLGTGRKPDDSSWLIVLQFAEYGSLHSYLCQHTTNWMMSLKLCQSLSEGLSYLHSDLQRSGVHKPSVAHRDLSSSNVLVRADGTCVLCDFGCATILRSCSGHYHWQSQMTSMKGHAQMVTLRYRSPEILEGFVDLSSGWCLMQGDIYSLGLLLWEIWMRCFDLFEGSIVPLHLLPYESELEASVTLERLILFVFHEQKRPSIPEHWKRIPQGSAVQELLTDCWDSDPDARLTARCILDRLVSLQACYSP